MPQPTCDTSRTVVEPEQEIGRGIRRQWPSTGASAIGDYPADQVHGIVRDETCRTGTEGSAKSRASNREEGRKPVFQGHCRRPRGAASRATFSVRNNSLQLLPEW